MLQDGDLRGWTPVDVLPADGMQEVRGSNPRRFTFPQVKDMFWIFRSIFERLQPCKFHKLAVLVRPEIDAGQERTARLAHDRVASFARGQPN
jgi:hypothetical protein